MQLRIHAVAVVALQLAACHPYRFDTTSPAAPACAPPQIDTANWQIITVSDCDIRLKLPTKYRETDHQVTPFYRIHIYRSGFFNTIEVKWERFPNITLAERKTIRQNDYEDYTECNETIGGHLAILQSFRGAGAIISEGRQTKPFHVEAVYEIGLGLFVRISGHGPDRQSQEEVLATVRTAQFDNLNVSEPNRATVRMKMFFSSILQWLWFGSPLVGYLAVATVGAFMLFRGKRRAWRATHPTRYRVCLAAYLAIVLTPSVLSDFWLFMIPAPALLGFFFLLPSIFFSEQKFAIAYLIILVYVVPVLVGFGVFYFGLSVYARFRSRSGARRSN